MGKVDQEILNKWANEIMDEAIVSPSEYITVPGNTVEGYVDGLIEIFVDTSDMTNRDINTLRQLLISASNEHIEQEKRNPID